MNNYKTILLHEPLEFLIFNQDVVTLFFSNGAPCYGYTIELTDKILIIKIDHSHGDFFSESLNGEVIKITCDYRSKRLEFEATIKSYDENNRYLAVTVPNQAKLVNYRLWERTFFEFDPNDIFATISADTTLGQRVFSTNNFCEFSYTDISLYIDRKQGLMLPDDIVHKIEIRSAGNIIFQGSGKIARIEKSQETTQNILIVIRLDDPNIKPKLDIEPNKRQSDRYVFDASNNAFVEFAHPFTGLKKIAQILDISNYGVSVIMEDSKFAMPPGMLVEDASLQLPFSERQSIKLKVKAFTPEDENDSLKVSMAFVNPNPILVKSVTNYVQKILSENLRDATFEDLSELLYFYFETGFIYTEKRRHMQNTAIALKETFRRLLKNNTPLLKKILYKEDGEIKGHVTAIKVFDRTLMVQHLNALKARSESAAMQVVRAITAYFLDSKANLAGGNRYICFYYRPNNKYPATVFGESVKIIDNPNICWIRVYQYCLPVADYAERTYDNVRVSEAEASDLFDLESLIIEKREYGVLKLECLASEQILSMGISSEYEEIGLYRYRRVFVAEDKSTGQKVYAVCNYASPGLNFSELTNSIKLFYDERSTSHVQELVNAVCQESLKSYQGTDVIEPPLLLDNQQPVPDCFVIEKNYTLFALDINHTRKFKKATEHIFANFRQFVKRKNAAIS